MARRIAKRVHPYRQRLADPDESPSHTGLDVPGCVGLSQE